MAGKFRLEKEVQLCFMKDANIYNQYPKYLGRFVSMVREQVEATSPQAVADYLLRCVYHPFDEFEQEEVVALLLNARQRITHRVLVGRGTLTSALVRPADLYRTAVRANAAGLILAHNHPSGAPRSASIQCS
jgi:DNA repair protein RadC